MNINDKLTQRQLLTIKHILESSSIELASRNAKVTRATIYQWLKNDDFKKELKRQRDELVSDSLDRLKCAINRASDGLIGLMSSKREDIRRLACKDVLEFAIRALEMEKIEERLEKIEARMDK